MSYVTTIPICLCSVVPSWCRPSSHFAQLPRHGSWVHLAVCCLAEPVFALILTSLYPPFETYNALVSLSPSSKLFPPPTSSFPLVTMLPPPIPPRCLSSIPTSTLYQILQPIIIPASDPHARFYNWSKTFTCSPLITFEPSNVEECRLIFELARREDRTVRTVGAGLSPSDVGCTTEFMLRTHRMNKIRAVRG